MFSSIRILPTGIFAVALLVAMTSPLVLPHARAHAQSDGNGVYQIMKATEDRVWRLNKDTGEIAVCTLSGENLFCTTTNEAVDAPKMTYEEWDAKRKSESLAAEQAQTEKKQRDLAFMDRMLELARSFIHTMMNRDQGN